jgi:SAM-dependent methyltransferase
MLAEFFRHPILTARFILRRIRQIPSEGLPNLRRHEDDAFDSAYGVETATIVRAVPTASPNVVHGVRYQPSSETAVRWCIENSGMVTEDTTFVDIGCGKGRVLILAAMYPFKKIVGVEYSPELASACCKNLEKLRLADRCEVVVGDAVDMRFPKGPILAYLYNPFDSSILNRVLKNMASIEGPVRVGYVGPEHNAILDSGARPISSDHKVTLYEISTASVPAGLSVC